MLSVLFGNYKQNLRFTNKIDFLVVPFKARYINYTLAFLIFTFLFYLRSLGAFGNPLNERFDIIKKILLHLSAIFLSFIFWGIIVNVFLGTYN
mgnify:CR=1 FL=1